MNDVILLTGASGFVGSAVLQCADQRHDTRVTPLYRDSAVSQIHAVRSEFPQARVSLLNLAWPALPASTSKPADDPLRGNDWLSYREWLADLLRAAADAEVRFFQVGSGIERVVGADRDAIAEPYRSYADRKHAVWEQVRAALPASSWRFRLHFLFGSGESPQRLIPAAIDAAMHGRTLSIGSPQRRRAWADVADVACGLLQGITEGDPQNWDICGATLVSIGELIELVGDAVGSAIDIVPATSDPADANCLEVIPEAPAPFLSENLGSAAYLRGRLTEYARTFAA